MELRGTRNGSVVAPAFGGSRIVRLGSTVYISGTTSTDGHGNIVGRNDPETQAHQCLTYIKAALESVGATLHHVIRTRIRLANMDYWNPVSKAHGEFFGKLKPPTTIVEVTSLLDPALLVEIEADAVVPQPRNGKS